MITQKIEYVADGFILIQKEVGLEDSEIVLVEAFLDGIALTVTNLIDARQRLTDVSGCSDFEEEN